eukprot:COSAG01_NODE_285_length_19434_cov_131.491777_17_plen_147_part_00
MIDAPRYEAQHYCVAAEQLLAAAAATPSPRADPQGVMKLRSAKQQLGAKLSPAWTIARAGVRRSPRIAAVQTTLDRSLPQHAQRARDLEAAAQAPPPTTLLPSAPLVPDAHANAYVDADADADADAHAHAHADVDANAHGAQVQDH